jgi:hypothetical protein
MTEELSLEKTPQRPDRRKAVILAAGVGIVVALASTITLVGGSNTRSASSAPVLPAGNTAHVSDGVSPPATKASAGVTGAKTPGAKPNVVVSGHTSGRSPSVGSSARTAKSSAVGGNANGGESHPSGGGGGGAPPTTQPPVTTPPTTQPPAPTWASATFGPFTNPNPTEGNVATVGSVSEPSNALNDGGVTLIIGLTGCPFLPNGGVGGIVRVTPVGIPNSRPFSQAGLEYSAVATLGGQPGGQFVISSNCASLTVEMNFSVQ